MEIWSDGWKSWLKSPQAHITTSIYILTGTIVKAVFSKHWKMKCPNSPSATWDIYLVPISKFHDLLQQYPRVCRAITHFALQVSACWLVEYNADLLALFLLLKPTLTSLDLTVEPIFCLPISDLPVFVAEYVTPVIKTCDNLTSSVLLISGKANFNLASGEGKEWVDKLRTEGAPCADKNIPKLKWLQVQLHSFDGLTDEEGCVDIDTKY